MKGAGHSPALFFGGADVLQENGDNDDRAADRAGEEGGNLRGNQRVVDDLEHQHAQERADDLAASAAHGGAADGNGSDGVHFKQVARAGGYKFYVQDFNL